MDEWLVFYGILNMQIAAISFMLQLG